MIVFFDLEFTAFEGSLARRWLAPGEFKEVVQIGAVKTDADTLRPVGELNLLVRPRINAKISDYLERLTGISHADIAARGMDFSDAYRQFVDFAGSGVICAFGRDDLVLMENLRLYGIADAPPLPAYVNIVPWLAANGIDAAGLHACDVARICGAEFSGSEHDALDDARSVFAGVIALIRRGTAPPCRTDETI